MAKGAKLAKLGLKRAKGFMYYVKGNAVWRFPQRGGGGPKQKVQEFNAEVPAGTFCYLDKDGDVCCAARKSGRAPAVKSAPAKKPKLNLESARAALAAAKAYIAAPAKPAKKPKFTAAAAAASLAEAKQFIATGKRAARKPKFSAASAKLNEYRTREEHDDGETSTTGFIKARSFAEAVKTVKADAQEWADAHGSSRSWQVTDLNGKTVKSGVARSGAARATPRAAKAKPARPAGEVSAHAAALVKDINKLIR